MGQSEQTQPTKQPHPLFSEPFAWQTSSRTRQLDTNEISSKINRYKKPSGTKVRIAKPNFRQFQVEATDNFKAPVAKLAQWLANDPTNQKKFLLIRKGQNIIDKSQRYEIQHTKNDSCKDLNIPEGTVASTLEKIQRAVQEVHLSHDPPSTVTMDKKGTETPFNGNDQFHPQCDSSSLDTDDSPVPASINSSFDLDDTPRPTSMFSRQKWLMKALHNCDSETNPYSGEKITNKASVTPTNARLNQMHPRPPRHDNLYETTSTGCETYDCSVDSSRARQEAVKEKVMQSFDRLRMEGVFPKGDAHRTKQQRYLPKNGIHRTGFQEEARWVSKSVDIGNGFDGMDSMSTKNSSKRLTGPPSVIEDHNLLSASYSLKSDISVDLSYPVPSAGGINETWSTDPEIETASTPSEDQDEGQMVDGESEDVESDLTMDIPTVNEVLEKFHRGGEHGTQIKLLTQVQLRKERLERLEMEFKRRSGPYGLLKPTWKKNKAKWLPSDGYTRSFHGNVAPKKTLEELP